MVCAAREYTRKNQRLKDTEGDSFVQKDEMRMRSAGIVQVGILNCLNIFVMLMVCF